MTAPAKPVDLADMRNCAGVMRLRDQYQAAVRIDAMADELESLRALRDAVHKWALAPTCGDLRPDEVALLKAFDDSFPS